MPDDRHDPVAPPRSWGQPEAHLAAALSHPWYKTVSRLTAVIASATSEFYRARDIAPALVPVTCGAVSSPAGLGSDSIAVSVSMHGQRTYLADSMQFQLEALLRHGYVGVYYIMPTFRGEDHDATHLNQFFHSEAEIRGGLEEVMELVQQYVLTLVRAVLKHEVANQVRAVAGTLAHLEKLAERESFQRITQAEAAATLGAAGVSRVEDDFVVNREGERRLVEMLGDGVWLSDPAPGCVPFYQATTEQGTAAAADLLLTCGTEVAGCGARHRTGAAVRAALGQHRINPGDYEWYIRMKDAYPMDTAGFGLGIERLLMWMLRHHDIRDLQVMPRLKGVPEWL